MNSQELVIESLPGTPRGQGVLFLRGPLTMENVSQFKTAVQRQEAPKMILDLSEVPYIDSIGLGSLVSTYVSMQKSGRWIALVGVNDRVSKLFEITRVHNLFLTFSNVWEAIDALANAGRA